ncbi:Uncharacterised protein [Vibrio metschnikovii]|nr:Uncharacterised protein [Vibrio metschnikovii]SUQ10575.1 Uncharacterised protein [Vibrio metschnikovii]
MQGLPYRERQSFKSIASIFVVMVGGHVLLTKQILWVPPYLTVIL